MKLSDTSIEQMNLYFNLGECLEKCQEKYDTDEDVFYFLRHTEVLINGLSLLSPKLQEIFSWELYYALEITEKSRNLGDILSPNDLFEEQISLIKWFKKMHEREFKK